MMWVESVVSRRSTVGVATDMETSGLPVGAGSRRGTAGVVTVTETSWLPLVGVDTRGAGCTREETRVVMGRARRRGSDSSIVLPRLAVSGGNE